MMSEVHAGVTENIVRRCGHCGKVRALNFLTSSTYKWYNPETGIYGQIEWSLLQCPACLKPTLNQASSAADAFPECETLYPSGTTFGFHLPPEIAQVYASALRVRDVSTDACAVLMRRTLEVICHYEQANGKTIQEQIQALATCGRLPQLLADMAYLMHICGAFEAHILEDEMTKSDVTTLIDFVEAILEYLYVAPAKMAAVQKRLNKMGQLPSQVPSLNHEHERRSPDALSDAFSSWQ
jgi:hypothetical protein